MSFCVMNMACYAPNVDWVARHFAAPCIALGRCTVHQRAHQGGTLYTGTPRRSWCFGSGTPLAALAAYKVFSQGLNHVTVSVL